MCAISGGSSVPGQIAAARIWSQWEGDTISIRGPEARPSKFNEIDFAIAFARIECHFFANDGFFPEKNWILNNVDQIRNIPGWIVQGPLVARFEEASGRPLDAQWGAGGDRAGRVVAAGKL